MALNNRLLNRSEAITGLHVLVLENIFRLTLRFWCIKCVFWLCLFPNNSSIDVL